MRKRNENINQRATFLRLITSDTPYSIINCYSIINKAIQGVETVYNGKKMYYYNMPVSFDIETTSFYSEKQDKTAIMYEWSFGINGAVIIGRTWDDFLKLINTLSVMLGLNDKKRVIIYVHNLAYEFQFIRKHFKWSQVFSIDERKPVYAVTENNIEFRCSYILSGYNLDLIGKNLLKYKCTKKTGDLDYSLLRHSSTPLSDKELKYCIYDVKTVMCYIQEKIETEGDITKLQLTKTGYVRKLCRDNCFKNYDGSQNVSKLNRYRNFIQSLTLSPAEYKQLKRAFHGGFTHANAYYSNEILTDIGSYDFTSSYPAVMCSELFPMSTAKNVTITSTEEFDKYLNNYCCLFDVEFTNIKPLVRYEHCISVSKCYKKVNAGTDNGRLITADLIATTLTDVDYRTISKFYTWDSMKIGNFKIYERGYLPRDLIHTILELYQLKTQLKGVVGKEREYMNSKENINSTYGMIVTDICRDDILYNIEWTKQEPDINDVIDKYNKSLKRFLFYPWGVWVTAYAQANLCSGILEFKDDYVYSDTDSIKGKNCSRHADYIKRYNELITRKLTRMLNFYGFSHDLICPKTIKGIEKPLGVWDYEGKYDRFKTLGAKRYMTEKDGVISITVSGLNKAITTPYLIEKYENVFECFNDNLYIPSKYTGKSTHTYIDDERCGKLVDYRGSVAEYKELTSVHLECADYSLSLSREYAEYIKQIKTIER